MKYRIVVYICIVLGSYQLVGPTNAAEETNVSLVINTKAVFIYHFTKYIHWLDDDTTKPFYIVVFGDGEMYQPLMEISKKKTVNQRDIVVTNIFQIDSLEDCHILFISNSEKRILSEVLNLTRNKNILTVGDTEGFAKKGVAVNFVIREDKIRFEINSTALEDLKLRVSSQLLKLAILVKGK